MSNRVFLLILFLTCGVFVAIGTVGLERSGIQTDEALFGGALYPPYNSDLQIRLFKHDFSLMVMPYVGSLKAFLWAPAMRIWGPTAYAVRVPALLLGALSIWLFGLAVRRVLGEWPSLGAAGLLATDPMYLLTTRWDWGPVAIQHVCFTGAILGFVRYHQTGSVRPVFVASLLCGLGLWDKAVFLWSLTGIVAGGLLFLPKISRKTLGIAAVGLVLGSLPLLIYNIRSNGGAFKSGEGWSADDIPGKARLLRDVMQGAGLHGSVAREQAGDPRNSGFLWLVAVCAAAGLRRPSTRRVVLFALIAGTVAWLWMAFLRGAGGGTHHVVLLWPLPHWIVAAGLAAMPWRLTALLVAGAAVSQSINTAEVLRNEANLGSQAPWSAASYKLPAALRTMRPDEVYVIDWGFYDTLRLLGRGAFRLRTAEVPMPEEALRNEANLYVTHVDSEEVAVGITKRFLDDAERRGFEAFQKSTLADGQGRPIIAIFRIRPKEIR